MRLQISVQANYILFCMLVRETLFPRKRNVDLLLILRAYRAHPTRWIDVLNDVTANTSRTTPSALRDRNISSAESRMSVKPGKLMSAGIIGDEVTIKKTRCNCGRPVRPGRWDTKTEEKEGLMEDWLLC